MNTILSAHVKAGVLVLAAVLSASSATGREFHVAVDGSDEASGAKDAPFATIAKARDAIRKLGNPAGARVWIGPGRYFISKPLELTPADSGTKGSPVTYAAVKDQKVVISGARPIKSWRKESPCVWVADLPDVKAGKWYFRQLFAGDRRLTRARTPNSGHLTTAGALSKFAAPAKKRYGGYSGAGRLRREQPDAFCGFSFRQGDIKKWDDHRNAEIITFHSWECSWQTIRKIDLVKRDVHFNTPCRYPIGFFSLKCRYRIENISTALDSPGEWLLDKARGKLRYLSRKGEDPNKMDMLAPAARQLVVIAGDAKAKRPVQYVTFRGLSFQHAQYPMGVYDVAKNWPDKALKVYPDWPKEFAPGYTDSQAAPLAGQAIELTDANHIAFENCRITHCGAYAIKIGRRCNYNRIVSCDMQDLGGGGVLIGMDVRTVAGRAPSSDAPSHNEVVNSVIKRCSLVHPSAVGVWIAQSRYNRIAHNEIADIGYAGVHLGWTWGRAPNYTDHNIIEANDIHHVMRDLADAGGLYSLGVLEGCVYRANYIHDIKRAEGAVGAPTDGIFLDQGSKSLLVERNVIRNAGPSVVRFNQSRREDHTWKDNDFGTGHWGTKKIDVKQIISQAGPRKAEPAKP
ncbi:MAG: right-handed parallel beta-helix repeat-containing protein [Phycisphaerae bacterium]|jgi:hypothetical protein|nr:right-handed parallel beta-helix repeat-containing protein [Phycisphaerae bacterium]